MVRSDAEVKVGVFQVYHHKPITLSQHVGDGLQGDHTETLRNNVPVQVTEVKDGAKSPILLWNGKVSRVKV